LLVSPFGFVSPGKNRRPADSIHVRGERDPVTRGSAGNGILVNAIEPKHGDGKRGGQFFGSDVAAFVVANRSCRCRHVRREVVTMVQKLIAARLTVNYFFAPRMVPRSFDDSQWPEGNLPMQFSTVFYFAKCRSLIGTSLWMPITLSRCKSNAALADRPQSTH
jgi:hypothetical protein